MKIGTYRYDDDDGDGDGDTGVFEWDDAAVLESSAGLAASVRRAVDSLIRVCVRRPPKRGPPMSSSSSSLLLVVCPFCWTPVDLPWDHDEESTIPLVVPIVRGVRTGRCSDDRGKSLFGGAC